MYSACRSSDELTRFNLDLNLPGMLLRKAVHSPNFGGEISSPIQVLTLNTESWKTR